MDKKSFDVKVLRLKPGDILFVKVDLAAEATEDQMKAVRELWKEKLTAQDINGVEVVVGVGFDVKVVRDGQELA